MKKYKVICKLNAGHVAVQTLIWMLLSVVTLGLALPFFGYFFVRKMLNTTEIIEISV